MTSDPPLEDPRPPKLERAESLVLVNTGNGKGKSTAAFGTMLRALACDWNVAVVQFMKSGNWNTGEQRLGERLGVDWWTLGAGFTWDSDDMSEDEAVANEAWRRARDLIDAGGHRLVILDEVTYPINWGWLEEAAVVETIAGRPRQVSVLLTGRDAPRGLVDVADTVTSMESVKHAYESGVGALRGIDY